MADPSMHVPDTRDGWRLVDVCRAHLGTVARRAVGPLIGEGSVRIDGVPGRIAQVVRAGQELTLDLRVMADLDGRRLLTPPSPIPLAVLYADDDLLVVDKPHGLHVHPMGRYRDDTLLGRVLWHLGARPGMPWTSCAPSPAHRLDRPTGGLVMFALNANVRERLQRLLERHQVVRIYHAMVEGRVAGACGLIDVPLGRDPAVRGRRGHVPVSQGGQVSRTHWTVIGEKSGHTLLELRLETGRTHQLRAHLADLGHPIVGDVLYGAAPVGGPVDNRVGHRIELEAVDLRFPHPVTGDDLHVHRCRTDPWRR